MTDSLFLVFGAIIIVFFLLLIVKAVFGFRFCALCASVGATWVTLLILSRLRLFDDSLLIALLLGNSVVGVYYLVEKKTAETFHIFRLPFFLTLLLFAYALLVFPALNRLVPAAALLVFLWCAFGLLYAYRRSAALRSVISHIVNCCKNW